MVDFSGIPSHPRIILRGDDVSRLRTVATSDPALRICNEYIELYADRSMDAPVSVRKKTGKRLLSVSRNVERRVLAFSYMYLLTSDLRFAERAEREMLAAAGFEDWNPSHFLDVAEMTAALAIGYDWLYDVLSEEGRHTIERAIIDKGLNATANEKYLKFYHRVNNWNQVCNAGLTLGAIAVYDICPDIASRQIERSIESNRIAMGSYGPDGVYPEGYSYWGYGTWYEVLLIEALRTSLGSSFGLESYPGFLSSATFMDYMVAPSGEVFNFSDCGHPRNFSNMLLYWFAGEKHDMSILWTDRRSLQESDNPRFLDERLLPVAMLFASRLRLDGIDRPRDRTWVGGGEQPVFIYNERDDANRTFLAVKGGSASINHAHMDAGSFVYEHDGVRWASDPGSQDYHSLESKKVDLWNKKQESQRWDVFRIGPASHNTLTVDDARHVVSGNVPFVSVLDVPSEHGVVMNLTPVLRNVSGAERRIWVDDRGLLSVMDRVEAAECRCSVRWTLWTEADAEILNQHTVRLTRSGKTMLLRFKTSSKAPLTIEQNTPPHDYDSPNPGTRRVCVTMSVRPGRRGCIQASFEREE